jgi:hypothetical protein
VHADDDPCLGEPLCRACFDHQGALVWNNALGELWRRTTIYLPRELARLLGVAQKKLRKLVRAAYVKVAEYQRRGLVHVHAVIRLVRAMPKYRADQLKPPRACFTTELLERAIRAAAEDVFAPVPDELGSGAVGWGAEVDVRHLDSETRREVAGYLAKYATKSTEHVGGLLRSVTEQQLDALPVREHVRAYLRAAFALAGDRELDERRRFGRYAHTLGFRGHCLTKSRRYSTTFTALRQAREQHVHEQILARATDPAQRALAALKRITRLRYVGQGHITAADAFLAASAAARAREQRRLAREARAIEVNTGAVK